MNQLSKLKTVSALTAFTMLASCIWRRSISSPPNLFRTRIPPIPDRPGL